MNNNTSKPDHKILVLEGNPACGSKILSIAADGTRQKSGANQQQYYTPSQFSCNDIETFAAGIRNLEAQPNKFIILGQPRKPIEVLLKSAECHLAILDRIESKLFQFRQVVFVGL